MSPEALKVIGVVVIFVVALLGGWLPSLFSKSTKAAALFSLGNAFAGGVFLGAGMLHLLPHAAESFNHMADATAGHHVHGTPWAFILASAGILVILLIEKVIPTRRDFDETFMIDEVVGESCHKHAHGNHLHGATYPTILLTALSIHALFAGIAMGTESDASGVIAIIIAILAHKLVESFALGVTLAGSDYARKTVIRLIVIFALMTPIGVILGSTILGLVDEHSQELASAIFNSIAAGTFIYIATMDILNEEFHRPHLRWQKFGLVVVGFVAMALIPH